jgi:hypothetical protein
MKERKKKERKKERNKQTNKQTNKTFSSERKEKLFFQTFVLPIF